MIVIVSRSAREDDVTLILDTDVDSPLESRSSFVTYASDTVTTEATLSILYCNIVITHVSRHSFSARSGSLHLRNLNCLLESHDWSDTLHYLSVHFLLTHVIYYHLKDQERSVPGKGKVRTLHDFRKTIICEFCQRFPSLSVPFGSSESFSLVCEKLSAIINDTVFFWSKCTITWIWDDKELFFFSIIIICSRCDVDASYWN